MERERKFLVTHRPSGLAKFPHKRIRQGYLALPNQLDSMPVEVRVRDEAGKHILTVKGGRGASRMETEMPIAGKIFRSLWRLTKEKRIQKMRYRVPLAKKLVVELDIYRGKLRGLMTAEVEFSSRQQLRAFRPPDWLGREVTGQPQFSNSRLSMLAKPPAIRRR